MTSTMTREVKRLMERARERLAQHDTWRKEQRAGGFTMKDRTPEFCGAFRELLDMLVTELERDSFDADHAAALASGVLDGLGPFVPGGEFEAQS